MTIRLDRLSKLADYLETIPADQFRMDRWQCGSAACALGHACRIFHGEGLTMTHGFPEFGEDDGFEAGELFFGVSYAESRWLFTGTLCYRTTAHVVDRIRNLIAERTT